ncbi:DSD1 family PLP-dependent enzyme [Actinoplanes sp. NPDC051346]|uniref:DSD1 family PLP-dependent enzyme n=1 Tax=Actinoplanes sp. NPDC051346 TaxID=3155048 RepID=UPI0034455DE6
MTTLDDPDTPFAVLDRTRMDRNIDRLRARLDAAGVPLRLHVKTSKSLDVAAAVHRAGPGPVTVSTLAEAEYFADGGYTDILYAVGIEPRKLPRVLDLRRRGVDLAVLLDSAAQAEAVAKASAAAGDAIPALIEIDCDGHRGGIQPDDAALLDIGRLLHDGGAELRGVLDHAGESYYADTPETQRKAAQHERDVVVRAAERLRQAGLPAPVVSVGATPTAHAAADLTGVTEVRAGNYVFFDLVMAGIGVCTVDDLALSVVVTVIGHRTDKGWILTDGGWMATSRDRGTAVQKIDQGYGVVTDLHGRVYADLVMTGASQEHGTLAIRPGSRQVLPDLPIGSRVRILPNHACATAAQHREYHVIDGKPTPDAPAIEAVWPRHNGW